MVNTWQGTLIKADCGTQMTLLLAGFCTAFCQHGVGTSASTLSHPRQRSRHLNAPQKHSDAQNSIKPDSESNYLLFLGQINDPSDCNEPVIPFLAVQKDILDVYSDKIRVPLFDLHKRNGNITAAECIEIARLSIY